MFGAAAVGKVLQVNEHLRQSSHERSRVDRPEAELNASPTRTEGAATSQTSHGRMDLSLGRTSSAAVCRGRGTSAVGRRGRSKAMTKDAVWILWSGPSLSVSFYLPLHLPHCPPPPRSLLPSRMPVNAPAEKPKKKNIARLEKVF